MHRLLSILGKLYLWLLVVALARPVFAEDLSLHRQIDALMNAERVGPPAKLCSDAEFLRRVYLDLVGKIPSADEARKFLADKRSNKRDLLITTLLKDPHFDRNFMRVLDVMLMERKPEKIVSPGIFRSFIRQSLAEEKGLDQLIREILIADGAKKEQRPAARFLLDRAAEPHVITRDVGRLFLGIDMQCAQCHDHPSIDDYHQADYYGIYAFLNRSYFFGDEKKGTVAERAEGEASFVSVFVGGDPQQMMPHLPGGKTLAEPKLEQDKRYHVKPADGVRPVPKFSRRARLAEELTSGRYSAFQKNLANRIWAHMLGRGIVHPLDLHHSGNPPVHPELLEALGKSLVAFNFDLRRFVQEIARSYTYQRSSEIPPELVEYAHHADADRKQAEQQKTEYHLAAEQVGKHRKQIQRDRSQLGQQVSELTDRQQALKEEVATTYRTAQGLQTEISGYEDLLDSLESGTQDIRTLSLRFNHFIKLAPDNPFLTDAIKTTRERATLLDQERAQVQNRLGHLNSHRQTVLETEKETKSQLAALGEHLLALKQKEQRLQKQHRDIQGHQLQLQQKQVAGEARLKDFEALKQFVETTSNVSPDDAAQEEALQQLATRWRQRFNCGHVLPLTAEQMTWSISEAVGIVDRYREELISQTVADAKDKQASKNDELSNLAEKSIATNDQVEQSLHTKVEQALYDFIVNVHDPRGQPDGDYQATAREALFMSRSNRVLGWIRGGSQSLVERLVDTSSPQQIADELYLAILSRYPNPEETEIVSGYMTGKPEVVEKSGGKETAIQDLIWALLSCAEFRFQQ